MKSQRTKGEGGAKIWPESIDSKSISQGHYNFNSLLVIVVQSVFVSDFL